MEYQEISIFTTTPGIDIVSGFLTSHGIRGVMIEDPADFMEFLENTTIHWDYVDEVLMEKKNEEANVKFYLPDNVQGAEAYRQIKAALPSLRAENPAVELGRLELASATVNEEDWSTAWKKYYHPTRVGERLVVVPCWESYEPEPGQVILTLDPGMAFGTGTHETTRLCMRLLEKCVTPESTLLDVGTGSGILAITGLLLGAKAAVGVDIDELATRVAAENAELNRVGDRLRLYCGDLTEKLRGSSELPKSYDVICANIVADVIIRLAADVTRFMHPGSVLLCSGIIEERCEEVKEALTDAGLSIQEVLTENGWAAIRLTL